MALAPKRTLVIGAGLVGVLALYVLGNQNGEQGAGSSPAANPSQCRVTVTADVLNVRAAPDATSERVGAFRRGAETVAEKVVENGFRKLGDNRWVSAQYIQAMPGHDCG
jgi:hypothetical protein